MVSILAAISSAGIRLGLKPAARGSKNGPGRGGRQQCRIDTGCQPMMGKAFLEPILDDGDDGAFERYLSQLTGATCGFSEIVANTECNGAPAPLQSVKVMPRRSIRSRNRTPVIACSNAFLSG
jgi:hypothetical protein